MSCSFRPRLEDFAANRLSAEDRREVDAHLGTCPDCKAESARLLALRAVLSHHAPYEPSDADWQRLDRAVLSAMDSAREARPSWLQALRFPAFLLAPAAAAALLFFALRPAAPPAPAPAPIAVAPAPFTGALAVELGGVVRVTGANGVERTLESARLAEGDRLALGEGPLALQTAPATGARLAPASVAVLSRLAPGETALQLVAGSVAAEVKPLQPGQSFRVRAADLTVSVRGTAFVVAREAGRTRVEVVHGLVAVEREGAPAVLVPADSRLVVEDGAAFSQDSVGKGLSPEVAQEFPLSLPDRPLETLLALPLRRLAATAPAAAVVEKPAAPPAKPERPAARLSARAQELREAFGACVRARLRDLNGCYEGALKADPNLSGQLTLAVSLDATGAVRSVKSDRNADADFLACAREIVRRCEQPGTGEDELLELPLQLAGQ